MLGITLSLGLEVNNDAVTPLVIMPSSSAVFVGDIAAVIASAAVNMMHGPITRSSTVECQRALYFGNEPCEYILDLLDDGGMHRIEFRVAVSRTVNVVEYWSNRTGGCYAGMR